MATELSTFAPFRLTICGIPELDEHCAAGVTHVLSILDPDTPDPPVFAAFAPHRRLALRFHDIIETQPDQLAPGKADVERLLAFGHELSDVPGSHLLIHCHAGVSRSTASATLILAQARRDWPDSRSRSPEYASSTPNCRHCRRSRRANRTGP